jgi:hypothetical protein
VTRRIDLKSNNQAFARNPEIPNPNWGGGGQKNQRDFGVISKALKLKFSSTDRIVSAICKYVLIRDSSRIHMFTQIAETVVGYTALCKLLRRRRTCVYANY